MAEETQPKPRGKTVLRREIPLASGSTPGKLMICSSCVEQYQVRPFLSQHLSSSLMWAIRHVATQGVCGIPRFLALCCGLVVMHAWESVCAHIWRERERERERAGSRVGVSWPPGSTHHHPCLVCGACQCCGTTHLCLWFGGPCMNVSSHTRDHNAGMRISEHRLTLLLLSFAHNAVPPLQP